MDRDAIVEMFSAFGPVVTKRMFSGFGLYADEVCFCLVLRGGEFYLKADAVTISRFQDAGCGPFTYTQSKSGKIVSVNSFWRMPERLYDDPDELAEWARAAVGAAQRAQLVKRKRPKPAPKPKSAPGKRTAKVTKKKVASKPVRRVLKASRKAAKG